MTTILNRDNFISFSFTTLAVIFLLNCSTTKKFTDIREVKDGKYLYKAKEVALDTFLTVWLENTHPFKFDMNLNEVFKDSLFTYFLKQRYNSEVFLKLKNDNLNKVDYKSLNGDSIRSLFYDKIIPLEDKNKSNPKHCDMVSINFDFKYKFVESENIIQMSCKYKVTCEFLIRIIKETYYAQYDIKNQTIIKTLN